MTGQATRDALERLEIALAAMDHPIASTPREGLTDDQVDELTGQAGVTLPDQARELWKWRNGWQITQPGWSTIDGQLFPHNVPFLTLQEALSDHADYLNRVVPLLGVPALRPALLPAFRLQLAYISIDIDTTQDGDVSLVRWDADDPASVEDPANWISSIPAMLEQTVDLYRSGAYAYDMNHRQILSTGPSHDDQYWAF